MSKDTTQEFTPFTEQPKSFVPFEHRGIDRRGMINQWREFNDRVLCERMHRTKETHGLTDKEDVDVMILMIEHYSNKKVRQ